MIFREQQMPRHLHMGGVYQFIVLLGLTGLAALTRVYRLGEWSLWIDEFLSIQRSLTLHSVQDLFTDPRPLFFPLMWPALEIFGVNEWSARLVPMLIGMISIPLLYWSVKQVWNTPLAFLVALLLAISPWHIYWSQNARYYTLLLLLYNGSLFAFYLWQKQNQRLFLWIFLVSGALATATHPVALLLIPTVILYSFTVSLFSSETKQRVPLVKSLLFAGLVAMVFIGLETIRVFGLGEPAFLTKFINIFVGNNTLSPQGVLFKFVYYTGVPLAVLALFGGCTLLKKRFGHEMLFAWAALLPVVSMMLFSLFVFVHEKYIFIALPSWIMLAALTVKEMHLWQGRNRIIGAALYLAIVFSIFVKDPAIKDLLYYGSIDWISMGVFLLLGIVVVLIVVILLARTIDAGNNPGAEKSTVWLQVMLVPLFLHPLVMDFMYYQYQHGHRDRWNELAAVVRELRTDEQVVASALPTLARFYIDDPILYVEKPDWEAKGENPGFHFLIEEPHLLGVGGKEMSTWIDQHCVVIQTFDNYAAGVNFIFRLRQCQRL
jgi:4-amino-4-deoxy-L-arabinose transferase-like glycosyltransferase